MEFVFEAVVCACAINAPWQQNSCAGAVLRSEQGPPEQHSTAPNLLVLDCDYKDYRLSLKVILVMFFLCCVLVRLYSNKQQVTQIHKKINLSRITNQTLHSK